MARQKTLAGFDYVTGQAISLLTTEWRARLRLLILKGGFRRVEFGETFGHRKGGLIEFEVYGTVQL